MLLELGWKEEKTTHIENPTLRVIWKQIQASMLPQEGEEIFIQDFNFKADKNILGGSFRL